MNIFTGLLFQQGYIQDPGLALSLAGADTEQDARDAASERAKDTREDHRARFRSHAISSICGTTALSPFR